MGLQGLPEIPQAYRTIMWKKERKLGKFAGGSHDNVFPHVAHRQNEGFSP
jgi:hypothetical protein